MNGAETYRVTGIAADRLHPERVYVRLGDEVLVLDAVRAVQLGLREGTVLSAAEYHALQAEAALTAAKERALRLLGMKAYTERELAAKLVRSGFAAECTEQVIRWLREVGYLDDRAYAQRWVEQRLRGKGYGPARLRHELAGKGVAREWIDEALAQCGEDELEETAYRLAAERLRRLGGLDSPKVRRQIYGFLQRRGYAPEVIGRALRRLFGD